MSYIVGWERAAFRELLALPTPAQTAVYDAMVALEQNPRPHGCLRLAERPEWRIRVGDYRVIYLIEDADGAVIVQSIRHRREAYR